jgi:hypothetical protein
MIGATTLAEYRKYIESDSALERRFQPIIVEEPSIDDTIEILRGIKGYYESYHGITIPDMIISRTVILSERYITQLNDSRWLLECKVANLQGVARFVTGLLDDIYISESPELKDYITNYINKYLK